MKKKIVERDGKKVKVTVKKIIKTKKPEEQKTTTTSTSSNIPKTKVEIAEEKNTPWGKQIKTQPTQPTTTINKPEEKKDEKKFGGVLKKIW